MRRLIVNFARVGDMVLIIPLLRFLARDAELELIGRPWAQAVLGEQPWLQAIHTLRHPYRGHGLIAGMLSGGPLKRLAHRLRERHFDEIVVFRQESSKVMTWVKGWSAGIPLRVLDSGITSGASRHPIDMYRAALAHAGYDVASFDPLPRLAVSAAARARTAMRVRQLGSRVISLQAGSSLTHRWYRRRPNLKGLTASQWSGLITRILADHQADAVILHGSALERREARALRAALPAPLRAQVHDWTGQAPLEDLPGIFSQVDALLSVDTGPAHIAAAVGCPLLVVYGPSDPQRWLPRGVGPIETLLGSAPCQFCVETPVFKTCRDNICLNRLTPTQIHAAWSRLHDRLVPDARR